MAPRGDQVRDAVFWFDPAPRTAPALHDDVTTDVVVVGGGVMGLMCARTLLGHGVRVCLVEAAVCGGGASGRSSGFLTPDSELEFQDLVAHFGPNRAATLWRFALGGVEAMVDTAVAEGIACDLQPQDALYIASAAAHARTIRQEHAARTGAGFPSTLCPEQACRAVLGGVGYHGALRFGGTFGINAHRFCRGLRDALERSGARIHENTPVLRLLPDGVATRYGRVRAQAVVVCTDRLLPDLGLARREVYHVQTFLGVSRPLTAGQVERLFPAGPLMVWDTALIYRYFRLIADRRLLFGGGTLLTTYERNERHAPERSAARFARYLRRHFPGVGVEFEAVWPGLIGITQDFAPVVGRDSDGVRVHFAGGAAGLPWAAALGRLLAEQVRGRSHPVAEILSARRSLPLGRRVQAVLGRPATYALAHGRMKLE